jgi:tripartite-type tricarboxylate transporter receptor subunit TctC
LAPAGTPAHIVNRLNSDVAKIMNTPETQKAMYDAGVEVSLSTPAAMSQLMVSELYKWGKVVKEAGIKIE